MPPVFLSYRHEGNAHVRMVRDLAERLEAAGLQVVLDQLAQEREFSGGGPSEGWPQWSKAQAGNQSCKVLIVASDHWFRCYEGKAPFGRGLGAASEAGVIAQRLYNSGGISFDIRLVFFEEAGADAIPLDLQRYHRFVVPRDFQDLVQWLTGAVRPYFEWPAGPLPMLWTMANHLEVQRILATLLTRSPDFRYVPIQGPSESGKSHITKQLLGSGMRWPDVTCGRFDFKGTIDIEGQLLQFVQHLGVLLPPPSSSLSQRLSYVLQSLTSPPRPALLIFDTFEAAGEADVWVRDHLLVTLIRSPLLRVVIAGQRVPERGGTPWDAEACGTVILERLQPEDWLAFGLPHKPDMSLDFVRQVYRYCGGRAAVLAQLLGPTA